MQPLSYVPDGYTRDGYVAPVDGLHSGLRFEYRPGTAEDRNSYFKASAELSTKELALKQARLIHKHITSWDLKDKKGDVLPRSVDYCARLHPDIFSKSLDIILGFKPSDPDDKRSKDQAEEDIRDKMEAAEEGKTVGQARDARDEKNS